MSKYNLNNITKLSIDSDRRLKYIDLNLITTRIKDCQRCAFNKEGYSYVYKCLNIYNA